MDRLKKVFSVSLMVVTVLSLSLVTAPAKADTSAEAGDLIKIEGYSPVYYLGANGQRYVFPNEQTYLSWYRDFSSVVTLPQEEVESYALAGRVSMRPGTLVKRPVPTDPKVYVVTPGEELVYIPSETVASALYGANWASRIVDVTDAFFVDYTITGDEANEDSYPAGSLVQPADSSDIYYINSEGEAQIIEDEAAFLANRFDWDDVNNAPEGYVLPTEGDAISGAVASLIDTSQGATPDEGDDDVVMGSGLTVALSNNTPGARSIPSYAALVPFATFNLTASNDGEVEVDGLTLTRFGTGATTDFSGGYLYVDGERLTNEKTVNSSNHEISFSSMNLTIPAGETETVTLMMSAKTSGTVTGNHGFKIVDGSDIITEGNTQVSGSFPVIGNIMSYSAAASAANLTITASTNDFTRYVGESDVTLAEFDIANSTTREDVMIDSILLKQGGTADDDEIANLSLTLDSDVVAEGVAMEDRYVLFQLDEPYELDKSKTVSATVKGDIVSGVNKTVKLYLRKTTDLEAIGTAYGDFYHALVTNTSLTLADTDTATINGSEINVSFDGPSATEIKDNSTDVVLANFKISAEDEGVTIDTMPMTITMKTATATENLDNIEMVDDANNVSYAVSDPTTSDTSMTVNFENISLEEGVNYNFEIRGDVPDSVTAGQTYKVGFNFANVSGAFYDVSDTAVSTSDFSSASLDGKVMTVAAPAITIAKVTTNAITTVKEAENVLLYKGKFVANSVDDLTVKTVKFDASVGAAGTANLSTDFEKLYFYAVDGTGTYGTLLDTETSLADTSVTFSGFNLEIPAGLSNGVYVTVRGDVKTSPTGTTTKLTLTTTDSSFTIKDSDNETPTIVGNESASYGHITTVATLGTYTMTMDTEEAGVNKAMNKLAGTNTLLGRLKLSANKEAAIVEDLVLENLGTATNTSLAQLRLYKDKNMSQAYTNAVADLGSNKKAFFEDVNIEIPTTGVTYIYVGGTLKGIDYSNSPDADATAIAEKTIKLIVPTSSGSYTTKVVGKATSETEAVGFSTGASAPTTTTSTILGAVISGLATDFADATNLKNGTNDIFSFKVTVPESSNADYDGTDLGIKLATTTFTISANASITLSSFKLERVGGANGEVAADNAAGSAVSSVSGGGTTAISFAGSYGTNSDLIVRPGETAEYVLRASASGVTTNQSVTVSIESSNNNLGLQYTHNTGTNGFDGSDISAVYPKLQNVTYVRGGTISIN